MSLKAITEFHSYVSINDIKPVLERGVPSNIELTLEDGKVQSSVFIFFNGNNSILKKMLQTHDELCVFKISPKVMALPNIIIADRAENQEGASFYTFAEGVPFLNFSVLTDRNGWTDRKGSLEENRLKSFQRCAQLIVPNTIPSQLITGIYVLSEKVKIAVKALFERPLPIPIIVNPRLFFDTTPVLPIPSTPVLLRSLPVYNSEGCDDSMDEDAQEQRLDDCEPVALSLQERNAADDEEYSRGVKTGRIQFVSVLKEGETKKPRLVRGTTEDE
jgi:hypothetical protein